MKEKKQSLKSKVTYVKKNWMLYIFFLMPALLLTIIFKYVPMGGLLIAFKDYNVIKGVLGSPWVGLEYFKRFLSSPDFMNYLMNTLKVSIYGLLWGFPVPIILALLLNRIRKEGIIYLSGSDKFPRVKIGIGAKPTPEWDLADWVLSRFSDDEQKKLAQVFENAAKAVELMADGKIDRAMNLFN